MPTKEGLKAEIRNRIRAELERRGVNVAELDAPAAKETISSYPTREEQIAKLLGESPFARTPKNLAREERQREAFLSPIRAGWEETKAFPSQIVNLLRPSGIKSDVEAALNQPPRYVDGRRVFVDPLTHLLGRPSAPPSKEKSLGSLVEQAEKILSKEGLKSDVEAKEGEGLNEELRNLPSSITGSFIAPSPANIAGAALGAGVLVKGVNKAMAAKGVVAGQKAEQALAKTLAAERKARIRETIVGGASGGFPAQSPLAALRRAEEVAPGRRLPMVVEQQPVRVAPQGVPVRQPPPPMDIAELLALRKAQGEAVRVPPGPIEIPKGTWGPSQAEPLLSARQVGMREADELLSPSAPTPQPAAAPPPSVPKAFRKERVYSGVEERPVLDALSEEASKTGASTKQVAATTLDQIPPTGSAEADALATKTPQTPPMSGDVAKPLDPGYDTTAFNKGMSSIRYALEQFGEIGRRLSNLTQSFRTSNDIIKNRMILAADTALQGTTKADDAAIRAIVLGRTMEGTPKQVQAAAGLKAALFEPAFNDLFKVFGDDIGKIDDYLPLPWKRMLGTEDLAALKDLFVKRGMAADAADDVVDEFTHVVNDNSIDIFRKSKRKVQTKKAGSIDFSRTIRDPEVIALLEQRGVIDTDLRNVVRGYINSTSARLAQAMHFGVDNEALNGMIQQLPVKGQEFAKMAFDRIMRPSLSHSIEADILVPLKSASIVMNIATMPISQFMGIPLTAATTGFRNTMKGLKYALGEHSSKLFNHIARYAGEREAGVILNDGMMENALGDVAREYTGIAGDIANKSRNFTAWAARKTGLRSTDDFVRAASYRAAQPHVKEMYDVVRQAWRSGKKTKMSELAERQAAYLSGDTDFNRIKTWFDNDTPIPQEYYDRAAKALADQVSGKTSLENLPYWANTPWGDFFMTLQKTAFQTSAFQRRFILEPAMKGNMLPLARFAAMAQGIGIPVTILKDFLYGKDSSKRTYANLVMNGFANAYVGGIVLDTVMRSVGAYGGTRFQGRVPTGRSIVSRTAESVVPPQVDLAAQTYDLGRKIVTGKKVSAKDVPGSALRMLLTPVLGSGER